MGFNSIIEDRHKRSIGKVTKNEYSFEFVM